VLDNHQEVPAGAELLRIIQGAVIECPEGMNIVVISQTNVPAALSREVANNVLGKIEWDELQLTIEETLSLTATVPSLDRASAELLHSQCNGWAAGVVLMLDRFKETGQVSDLSQSITMASIFSYFAGQIFDKASSELQVFLMKMAILPRVTVRMAQEITGASHADVWLTDLYHRRLFIDRRAEKTTYYQFHKLFREFLLDRARSYFSHSDLQTLKGLAAYISWQDGQLNTAAELFAETEDWTKLVELVCSSSPSLFSQGRQQTVRRLISLLPEIEVERAPWVQYWKGVSTLIDNPVAALDVLTRAYNGFAAHSDIVGQFLSCSAIIDAYLFAEDDMIPVVEWGNKLQTLIRNHNGFPSPEIEGKILGSMQGLMYAAPHHPLLTVLDVSAERAIEMHSDLEARIAIAYSFLALALWRGDFRKARRFIDTINPQLEGTKIAPLKLVMWRFMEGNYAWCIAAHDEAQQKFSEALHLVDTYGMPMLRSMLYGVCVYSALAAGRADDAEMYLARSEAANQFPRRHPLSQFQFLRAGIALLKGDLSAARHHAQTAIEKLQPLGRPFLLANYRIGLAQTLIETGERDAADLQLRLAHEYAIVMKSKMLEVFCLLLSAYASLKEKELSKAIQLLREALGIAAVNDYLKLNEWWRPRTMASILSFALEHDIEADYVRSVIRRRHIHATAGETQAWPWPIKVYTLGEFSVQINDRPLRFEGKSQRKPLELLQCLCAWGGKSIHQDRLTEVLWPEADGDAAGQALRTTLHRLRKLLQHEEAVNVEDRQLSLDTRFLWVDAFDFERSLPHIPIHEVTALQRAVTSYRGHFLQGEPMSWALPTRERLRASYLALVERLGTLLETRGEVQPAIQHYMKAFEIEPVAEVICRRIINAYVHLGRKAEAIAVYQRFSHHLRTTQGSVPNHETIALYQSLFNR
jgi:two-component SAPR family response regulator